MKLPSSLASLAIPLIVSQLGGVCARLGGYDKGDNDDQLNITGIFFVDNHDQHSFEHRGLSSSEGFQLKMFWEKGMLWQEKTTRRNFCAECDKYCKAGEYVRVQECDDDTQDQRFYYKGGKIRSARTHLCLTFKKIPSRIKLQPCSSKKDESQLFDGFSNGGKFQLHPHKRNDMCMTQSHHPKKNEKLKLIPCRIAENNDKSIYDDTSHWVPGTYDGHSDSAGSHDWSPLDTKNVLDDDNDDDDDDWKCKGSTLKPNTRLFRRDFICTKDKKYRFGLNGSGRMVAMEKIGKKWKTYWQTNQGKSGHHITMQKDGNLVLYPDSGKALWASDTNDDKHLELEIKDDGDVELFHNGKSIWDLGKDG